MKEGATKNYLNVGHCLDHECQAATLAALQGKMNMLLALNGGFGTLIVGVLLSINSTTSGLNSSVSALSTMMKGMETRVIAVEERVRNLEKDIYILDRVPRKVKK